MLQTLDESLKEILGQNSQVTRDFPDGAFVSVTTEGAFVKYNTGDCIWLHRVDNVYRVYRIDTNDDIFIRE